MAQLVASLFMQRLFCPSLSRMKRRRRRGGGARYPHPNTHTRTPAADLVDGGKAGIMGGQARKYIYISAEKSFMPGDAPYLGNASPENYADLRKIPNLKEGLSGGGGEGGVDTRQR